MTMYNDFFTYDDDDFDCIELNDVEFSPPFDAIDDDMSRARIAALANDDVTRYIETFLAS